MYDHQSLILQQHAHRTSPQSGTSHPDASTSQAQPTRSMRAGSCSNPSNNTSVDSTMSVASPFDSEDSARADITSSSPNSSGVGPSISSPYDNRKRKCDALDRLPRTPLPSLSASPHLSTPRPRSATYSSGVLSASMHSSIRHNPPSSSSSCTASRSDILEDNGIQPKERSRSPLMRQRGILQSSTLRDNRSFSSPLSQVPVSALAARRRSIQSSNSEMTKRPRLESSASTSHLHVPGNTYGLQVPSHLDLTVNPADDAPSAPPSASFSTLTITQPPSPAYAAFSLQTPAPPCSPSKSSPEHFAFAEAAGQVIPPSCSDVNQPATCQSRPSSRMSNRRDKSPARPVRRRFKRATSLPLTDEITLAQSSLASYHKRSNSSITHLPANTTYSDSAVSMADANQLGVKQESAEQQERYASGQQVSGLVTHQTTVPSASGNGGNAVPLHQSRNNEQSSSFLPRAKEHSDRDVAMQRGDSVGPYRPLMRQVCNPSELLEPSQLAAIHQFNMQEPARLVPVLPLLNLPPLLVFPSRTQSYIQAQRRLPVPSARPYPPAPDTLTLISQQSTLSHIAALQNRIPPVIEQAKPVPTASVPAYTSPIARETLRELDLHEILQCRQLRHDIVFDANLMFRPNFDGDRGDRKREAADRYWTAVTRELETGCRCTAFSFAPSATARMMGKPSVPLPCICTNVSMPQRRTSIYDRLPSRIDPLIRELRDILLALLPSPSQDTHAKDTPSHKASNSNIQRGTGNAQMIIDTLDPELITQEVVHGVLDVSSLATFFGHIIKSHCAPMRDEIVETMVQTIKQGGQANDMSTVATGLRMCFEILELMKLDIANHQLRMLRPYLLESAAEFEYKTFLHLRQKKPQAEVDESEVPTEGPPLSKTQAWLATNPHRATSADDSCPLVIDGILELLFNPMGESRDGPAPEKISPKGLQDPLERVRKSKSQALPHSGEVPETLQLDIYRLQLFHGDTVDLCVVHLLLLLYRQLCSQNKSMPTSEDMEGIRRQIWVIMSEVNTAAASSPSLSSRRSPSTLPQSIKKLESERWREGMRDVLLQIARFSCGRAPSADSSSKFIPGSDTLAMLNGWMDNNLKADSKLFQLVQTRLRKTLFGLMAHELSSHRNMSGQFDMSSSDVNTGVMPEIDNIIKQNGLVDLSSEVRLLASRISKVAGFNARVFKDLYATML